MACALQILSLLLLCVLTVNVVRVLADDQPIPQSELQEQLVLLERRLDLRVDEALQEIVELKYQAAKQMCVSGAEPFYFTLVSTGFGKLMSHQVEFNPPFLEIPVLTYGISRFIKATTGELKVKAVVDNVSRQGFRIRVFRKGRIQRVDVTWMACSSTRSSTQSLALHPIPLDNSSQETETTEG